MSSKPTKKPGPGPADGIKTVMASNKNSKRMSFVAMKKAAATEGYDVDLKSAFLKRALKKMTASGVLTGKGVSGSFKLKAATKPAVKAKKPAVKNGRARPKGTIKKVKTTAVEKKSARSPKKAAAPKRRKAASPKPKPVQKTPTKKTAKKTKAKKPAKK